MKIRVCRIVLLFFVVLLMFSLNGRLAGAPTSVKVSVEPEEVTVMEGQTFNVNMTVTNVTDMNAWELMVVWKSSILNCTSYTINRIFEYDLWIENLSRTFNATHGRYHGVYVSHMMETFTGNATLVTLTFDAMGVGATILDLYDVALYDDIGAYIDGWSSIDSPDDGNVIVLPASSVGGVRVSIDKLGLLAPYMALAATVVAVMIGTVYARKRWLRKPTIQKPNFFLFFF